MSFRDDFYNEENILGYTGDLMDNPTVYFADAGGINPKLQKVGDKMKVVVQFGHITQFHPKAKNIGREPVREAYSYSICNVMYDGEEHAQECVFGEKELKKLGLKGYKTEEDKPRNEQHLDWHLSRNRFETVTSGNRNILAQALERHPNVKKMFEHLV